MAHWQRRSSPFSPSQRASYQIFVLAHVGPFILLSNNAFARYLSLQSVRLSPNRSRKQTETWCRSKRQHTVFPASTFSSVTSSFIIGVLAIRRHLSIQPRRSLSWALQVRPGPVHFSTHDGGHGVYFLSSISQLVQRTAHGRYCAVKPANWRTVTPATATEAAGFDTGVNAFKPTPSFGASLLEAPLIPQPELTPLVPSQLGVIPQRKLHQAQVLSVHPEWGSVRVSTV